MAASFNEVVNGPWAQKNTTTTTLTGEKYSQRNAHLEQRMGTAQMLSHLLQSTEEIHPETEDTETVAQLPTDVLQINTNKAYLAWTELQVKLQQGSKILLIQEPYSKLTTLSKNGQLYYHNKAARAAIYVPNDFLVYPIAPLITRDTCAVLIQHGTHQAMFCSVYLDIKNKLEEVNPLDTLVNFARDRYPLLLG